MDNERGYEGWPTEFGYRALFTHQFNRWLAQTISALMASLRCDRALNVVFVEFRTIWCFCARMYSMRCGYAQFITEEHNCLGPKIIWLEPTSAMALCDPCHDKQLVCSIVYRGGVVPKDVNAAVAAIKTKRAIQSVDW